MRAEFVFTLVTDRFPNKINNEHIVKTKKKKKLYIFLENVNEYFVYTNVD